ncbi:MAG: ABC transporter permease, partial [Candidatus Omnitrophica bacterium]|nr:ABC transporter permease [Candidatus Omnitrophota bacterium]
MQQHLSPSQMAFRRLKRNRLAVLAFLVIILLYLGAIFAEFLAPYHYDNEDRKRSYNPPTTLHFFDAQGQFHLRPFIYNYSFKFDQYYRRAYVLDKAKTYPLKFFVRSDRLHLFGVDHPARIYLLGADSRGRDLFSRIIYGSRVSLSIGLVGVAISFIIGTIVGGISGYFGGKIDNIIMRLCEMVMMIPGFYLMLALRAAFPPNLSSVQVYFLIVVILSFIGWAGLARVVRGMAISIREKEFVLAAQAQGLNPLAIITRHILPNTLSYTIVALSISIPGYILGESALSLLGLGIQDPHASWGNLLSEAMAIAQIKFHP